VPDLQDSPHKVPYQMDPLLISSPLRHRSESQANVSAHEDAGLIHNGSSAGAQEGENCIYCGW